jgi:hypothetical protein
LPNRLNDDDTTVYLNQGTRLPSNENPEYFEHQQMLNRQQQNKSVDLIQRNQQTQNSQSHQYIQERKTNAQTFETERYSRSIQSQNSRLLGIAKHPNLKPIQGDNSSIYMQSQKSLSNSFENKNLQSGQRERYLSQMNRSSIHLSKSDDDKQHQRSKSENVQQIETVEARAPRGPSKERPNERSASANKLNQSRNETENRITVSTQNIIKTNVGESVGVQNVRRENNVVVSNQKKKSASHSKEQKSNDASAFEKENLKNRKKTQSSKVGPTTIEVSTKNDPDISVHLNEKPKTKVNDSFKSNSTSKHRSEKRDEPLTGQNCVKWLAEERLAMAKQEAECRLRGDDAATINKMCKGIFPDRTLESIKCQRKLANYKALVENEMTRVKETSTSDEDEMTSVKEASRQPEVEEDVGPENEEGSESGSGNEERDSEVRQGKGKGSFKSNIKPRSQADKLINKSNVEQPKVREKQRPKKREGKMLPSKFEEAVKIETNEMEEYEPTESKLLDVTK